MDVTAAGHGGQTHRKNTAAVTVPATLEHAGHTRPPWGVPTFTGGLAGKYGTARLRRPNVSMLALIFYER